MSFSRSQAGLSPSDQVGSSSAVKVASVVHRNFRVYRRTWRAGIFFSFLQPFLFLTAMGIGIGRIAERDPLPGVEYLAFLAPGMMAAACMQTGTFESSYPLLGKVQWRRTYEAMLATPVGVTDILLGELSWITIRLLIVSGAFASVMFALDIARHPGLLLAIGAAVLTGLLFAAAVSAYSMTLKTGQGFNGLFRFVIAPLFLFSGTFFPIDRLPDYLEMVALATPLYHGVVMVRGFSLGIMSPEAAVPHLLYLVGALTMALLIAHRNYSRRLAS